LTTGLSYDGSVSGTSTFVGQLAELAVIPSTDINFQNILPMAISYAENRIYRDLDLLAAISPFYTSSSTGFALTAGQRFFNVPVDTFMTIQNITDVTTPGAPIGSAPRQPLLAVTRDFIDNIYGDPSVQAIPQYFAILSQGLDPNALVYSFQILLGPTPDQAYPLDIMGAQRPLSLSSTNETTFISLYLPELMLMAAMVYISGYQRNWSGSSANDPQQPINYEMQYQTLLKNAGAEEARKKYQASGWTALSAAPAASPARV